MSSLVAWRLHWQDFRGARIGMGDKPPEPEHRDFPPTDDGRRAAQRMADFMRDEAVKDQQMAPDPRSRQAGDLILSIAPVHTKPPRQTRKQLAAAWGGALPVMRRPPRPGMS